MKSRKQINDYNVNYLLENPINLEDYKDDEMKLLLALNLLSNKYRNDKLTSIRNNVQFFFWVPLIGIAATFYFIAFASNF